MAEWKEATEQKKNISVNTTRVSSGLKGQEKKKTIIDS